MTAIFFTFLLMKATLTEPNLQPESEPPLEASLPVEEANFWDNWHGQLSLNHTSRYMIAGFSVGDNHPVLIPSLTLSPGVPGLFVAYVGTLQEERWNDRFDEHDLIIGYASTLFSGPSRIDWDLSTAYMELPHLHLADKSFAAQRSSLGLALPELIPFCDSYLVPSYRLVHWRPFDEDQFQEGVMHQFKLSWSHSLPDFAGLEKAAITLAGDINRHDGYLGADADWSHSILSCELAADIAPQVRLSLGLYHQFSFDDTVNPERQITWYSLGITWSF